MSQPQQANGAAIEPAAPAQGVGAFHSIARRFGFKDAAAAEHVLTATVMPTSDKIRPTREQVFALAVVADQYKLNPWTRELYAYPDTNTGGIRPIVGYDGWVKIATTHPQFDGLEFRYGPTIDFTGTKTIWEGTYPKRSKKVIDVKMRVPEWVEGVLHRKDHGHPTVKRRYFEECYRPTEPWTNEPRHMIEVRTYCHTVRSGLGISGIMLPDEADALREREAEYDVVDAKPPAKTLSDVTEQLKQRAAAKNAEPDPMRGPANPPAEELEQDMPWSDEPANTEVRTLFEIPLPIGTPEWEAAADEVAVDIPHDALRGRTWRALAEEPLDGEVHSALIDIQQRMIAAQEDDEHFTPNATGARVLMTLDELERRASEEAFR